MDPSNVAKNLDNFHLDVLGQRPRINQLYTPITICFPVPDDAAHFQESLVRTLTEGMERLSINFPWLAGKVVNERGTLKIRRLENIERLIVRDLRHDHPDTSWNALRQAKFPFRMLDESIFAPCKTFMVPDDPALNFPVFLIQVNFVTGGLLLTFNGQHGSMDMTGLGQVIHLFAKACRNEPFTPLEISIGNMNRQNLIPLLDASESLTGLKHQILEGSPDKEDRLQPLESSPTKLVWTYFAFSNASLASLKSIALKTISPGTFVSTDDCLSAFIWQSIVKARQSRFATQSALDTTLSRAVDPRSALSIPSTYPGLVTNATFVTFTMDSLVGTPLGSVAAQLRSALEPTSLKQSTCALATLIRRHENADRVGFANTSIPELDIRLSSWAKEKFYDLEFGFGFGIQKPEAVRRPRLAEGSREGLVYFLPKSLDGDILVGCCLRAEDLERMRDDEGFTKFATYIG
ncbi:MAG: hypothetical protein M1821_000004 [Bathelium mastoideum]|nr:MAG: hypothetical protein M1821_000004 [Bathelium mastoideum]KAI9687966.1 MAG: hypothetical protein M1822_002048 [Bathelium mastoideum]